MDLGSHPSTNLNILVDGFIVIQGCAQLMSPKWNMGKGVCGRLGGLSVQENCGTGRLTSNRKGGDFLSWFQLQMDLGRHPLTNLNILLDRFIVIQGCGKLVSAQRNMSKGIWWRLRGLSVKEN